MNMRDNSKPTMFMIAVAVVVTAIFVLIQSYEKPKVKEPVMTHRDSLILELDNYLAKTKPYPVTEYKNPNVQDYDTLWISPAGDKIMKVDIRDSRYGYVILVVVDKQGHITAFK